MFELFFKLLVAHVVADFALQSDIMAKGKNRHNKISAPPNQKVMPGWPYWLSAHALIHGGAVYLVTGSLILGCVETVLHWLIDFAKCEGWTNPHQDQLLHILCRVGYVFVMI